MISIVFATFNGTRTLPKMLEALCNMSAPASGFEIIAIDNGSTDATLDLLNNYVKRLPLQIFQQPVRGKNRALNLGIEHVKGDLVVLTDDDIIPAEDWLLKFEACALSHPEKSLFGGAILPHWESPPSNWIYDSVPLGITFALTAPDLEEGPIFPGLVWGANMMIRRAVFDAGHRFNENVGPSAGQYIMGSETEFNIRISQHGYQAWFCPSAKVAHIIRTFQIEKSWIFKRAYRYGRNKCLQDFNTEGSLRSSICGIFNFPKWMLRRVIQDFISGHLALINRNERLSVTRLWDSAFYRGYIFQAQQLKASGTTERRAERDA